MALQGEEHRLDILNDKEYIEDLRERIKDLSGQLLTMQMRAIVAEKALAGAETNTALAKEDLQHANEQLADARRLLNQWRMMAEERVTWPEHQERTLRETRQFLGMEAEDGK